MMKIYDASNNLLLDVEVDDNSYRYRAIMGDHNLTLYFALAEHVELPVGAWCEFQAQKYYLMRPQSLKMRHTRYFEYTAVFEAAEWRASTWKFRCIYTDEKKTELTDGRVEFSLTATAKEFLQMVVDNLNYRDSGWSIGDYVSDGTKTVSFSHNNILEALQMIADEFETEYEIDGKTVHLHKLSYYKSEPLALSYGKGNGIKPDVQRSNTNDTMPVERLWVQGGDQNIDKSKYGSKTLHLPKGGTLSYDGENFEGEDGYDSASARTYVADAKGESITRSDKAMSTYAEDSLDCTDVYPKRVGTISGVVVRSEDKNWYDVYDDSIPDALDYNDCTIGDENMTIIFQTGMLAGKEFDIIKYVHGESASERYFEVTPQEIDGVTMPGGVYIPAVGDTYAIFNCTLPDSYISDSATKTGAEWDMFREAVKYMYENEDEKYTISASLDGIWAKKDWVNIGGRIRLGSYIKFTDERFFPDGVLVRITGIKDYINKPHSPEIELSNDVTAAGFSSTMKKLEATPVLIEDVKTETRQYTKRRWRDAQDTMDALQELVKSGFSKFTDGISPISVQTMQLLVGDESLQFRFVTSKTSPKQTDAPLTYNKTTKQVSAAASIIQHMTLGIANLSNTHSVSEYKFWDVSSFVSAVLDDATKRYYIYIKASKTGTTASFLLSETALDMEGTDGYYYFLYGILNTEYDGDRSIAELFGYTEILPGRVTTDKIVSSDGTTYFDLVNGIIGGRIKFRSTSGAERDMTEVETEISNATITLTNWASDGKISPTEKLALKNMLAQIEQDYLEVIDQCNKYSISTASFTSAYSAAVLALNKYTKKSTWDETLDVGSDYQNIAAYWEAKKTVLLLVNAAISGKFTSIKSDVDDAKSDAANALAEAQSAQTELSDWASDKSVSPAEKKSLEQMEAQIKKDYEEIVDRCGKYGIAYSSLTTAYNNAIKSLDYYTANPTETTAIDDVNYPYHYIADYWTARTTQLLEVNTHLNDYAKALVDSAVTDLSTAITNGDQETYDDALNRIMTFDETTIEGGYIKTKLINTELLQVRRVIAGIANKKGMVEGRRVEIDPDTQQVAIYDDSGSLVQVLEGIAYTAISQLFSSASDTVSLLATSGSFSPCTAAPGYKTTNSAEYETAITSAWQTTTPTEITLGTGEVYLSVKSGIQGTTAPIMLSNAEAYAYLRVRTYSDSACSKLIEDIVLASSGLTASYNVDGTSTLTDSPSWAGKSVKVKAGYHKVFVVAKLNVNVGGSTATVTWGKSTAFANLSYNSEFYVSRFFANGFCLGTSATDYLFAFKQSSGGMRFMGMSGGYSFDFSSSGVKAESSGAGLQLTATEPKMMHHSGSWLSLPLFIAKFRVTCTSSSVSLTSHYTWNGVALSASANASHSGTGIIKITYPTTAAWTSLGLNYTNQIIIAVGYKSSSEYSKPTIADISPTGFTLYLSGNKELNDNTGAEITIFKISS